MKKDRSNWTVRKFSNFAEAEESNIEYYAFIDWKESAATVERIRMQIWGDEYNNKVEKIIRRASLKDLTDDFE